MLISLIAPARPKGDVDRPSFDSFKAGFRFLVKQPVILGTFVLDTNAMVFGMPQALFPAVGAQHFDAGAGVVGFLYASLAVGALLASLLSGWIEHVRRQGIGVAAAIVVWGGAIAGFGFATALWVGMVMLAIAGAADSVSATLRSMILYSNTPDAMRGRMNGIELAQVASTPAIGNVEAGVVASLTSLRSSIVSGGVALHRRRGRHPRGDAEPRAVRRQGPVIGRDFFARSVHEVAPDLIGVTLLVDGVGGPIVEVEAYDPTDPASHAYRGRTPRNAAMFGPPGHAYVYRSYGIHWCLNLVCEEEGSAAAVLVRALEPEHGVERMRERRRVDNARLLAAGPGRLTEALGVTGEHDGLPLDRPPFELRARDTRAGDRRRPADRDHPRRRPALALRARRLAVRQPPRTQRVTGSPGAAAKPPPRGRCRTIFGPAPRTDRDELQPPELLAPPPAAASRPRSGSRRAAASRTRSSPCRTTRAGPSAGTA